MPLPINYRKDLWDAVGVVPDTWEDIRRGGRNIRQQHGISIGIGLAPDRLAYDYRYAPPEIFLSGGALGPRSVDA